MARYFIKALYLTILLLLMLSSGCFHLPRTPRVSGDVVRNTVQTKIPLRAAIVFPEEFQNFKVNMVVDEEGKRKWSTNLKIGKSSVKYFKRILPLMFEDVEFFQEYSHFQGYDILIRPQILNARAQLIKDSSCGSYISYKVSFFDSKGEKISETRAEGHGVEDFGGDEIIGCLISVATGFLVDMAWDPAFSKSFAKAEAQAITQIIENLKSSSELMTYAYAFTKLEPGTRLLKEGKKFYIEAKFDKSIEKLEEAIDFFQRCHNNLLKNQLLSDAYLLMGCTYIGKGQREIAKENFVQALDLDRKASLDPALASPKIQKFFNKIRLSCKKSESI